ncbi:hypothetical protein FHX08_003879 [Rhizobium sp. BK529]|nr:MULTISPECIES: hypothetical protein [unclassified Rhizobium]MBB3593476.1 hypothetical protein [Rhizobium sp. BK529]
MSGAGPNGEVIRKAGITTIVLKGGDVIEQRLPAPPFLPLERV